MKLIDNVTVYFYFYNVIPLVAVTCTECAGKERASTEEIDIKI